MSGVPLQPSGAMALRVSASMMALVLVALGIRIWARLKAHKSFLLEDQLIVVASALFYADQAIYLYGVMGEGASGGSEPTMMLPPMLNRYFQYLFAQQILFVLCITVVKLSILVFYRHIFSTRAFKLLNWGLIALCSVWGITTLFLIIFQCKPVYAMWTFELQMSPMAQCINSSKLIFGFEVTNIIIDVALLVPPILMVQKLQLRTAKKASVIAVFLLGGFVCITCAIRSHYIWDPVTGQPRSLPAAMDWSTVELASAIICACLPTYGPLLSVPAPIRTWTSSLLGSWRSVNSKSKSKMPSKDETFADSQHLTKNGTLHSTSQYVPLGEDGADAPVKAARSSETYEMRPSERGFQVV